MRTACHVTEKQETTKHTIWKTQCSLTQETPSINTKSKDSPCQQLNTLALDCQGSTPTAFIQSD